ncbi:hypothetical protein [Polynucleobacter sp.]|uniref:hypothetical protein n=1 Tax=Polynucleobacter sp. TaxID=2029855 RepID=UPI002585528C|nr:hypothetical protein [Polynucleobacter sp.]MCX7237123.1 hypothetical protein [Polynucleobacter sp.]
MLAAERRLRYSGTRIAEQFARQYLLNPTPTRGYELCKYIFKIWASQSGNRVFGKLETKNADLGQQLHKKFQKINLIVVQSDRNFEMKCIEQLSKINGLGISYSSKLLKILYPRKFATLDSILRDELGYQESLESYQAFIDELHRFKRDYKIPISISKIEATLFVLISSKLKNKKLDDEYKCFNYKFI